MHAIQISQTGKPDVLDFTEVPDPRPGPGDLLVRVAAAGVNFIDTYHRGGLYPLELPFVPGLEGAGVVEAVGDEVEEWTAGDRTAWTGVLGSYAELAAIPADKAVAVPGGLDLEVVGASMLQGLTAHYLVNDTYALQPGDRCLIHAAAGGVGRLLVQLAKRAGAEVFATAGSAEKAELARAAGADHVIDYTEEDFRQAIEDIAGPRPMAVVYDGVGAATFDGGLELLARRGLMVAFGNASGPVPPVDPLRLSRGGSLYLTRPTLVDYVADQEALATRAQALFGHITRGELEITIDSRYPLAEATAAHEALEGRRTTGKVLLIP